MSKFIDLIGQKFGRLTVIGRAECPEHLNSKYQKYYKCKCDCR